MDLLEQLQNTPIGHCIWTFLVSMIPVLELRAAIPIGVSMGLHPWVAMLVAMLGNMVPVPFIILFTRRIFTWLRVKSPWLEKQVSKLEAKAEGKWEKWQKYEFWGLAIVVGIPLPGTGAWTGALIAALINMRMKRALPSILIGVIIAGIIITAISYGFVAVIG